jgi:hypothetical protein
MPRTRALLAVTAVLASLAVPASAMADPGVIERATQGPAGGNGNFSVDQGQLSEDGRCVLFNTPEAGVPAGAGIHQVSTAITGLTPGTTYHYRLVVTSPGGTTTSAERTFTTLPPSVGGGGPDNGGNDGGMDDGGDHGTPGTPEPFAGVSIAAGTVKVKRGVATVKVGCPAAAKDACSGKLTLKASRRAIGSKSFKIAPGKTAKVNVRITRAGKKLLAKRRKLKAAATAVARDARGTAVKTPAKLTLKSVR